MSLLHQDRNILNFDPDIAVEGKWAWDAIGPVIHDIRNDFWR